MAEHVSRRQDGPASAKRMSNTTAAQVRNTRGKKIRDDRRIKTCETYRFLSVLSNTESIDDMDTHFTVGASIIVLGPLL